MSYDIYGEPLRRGHCEVHPHVHEEYPCSVCLAEKQRHGTKQGQYCDGDPSRCESAHWLGQARDEIDALRADNRRLRWVLEELHALVRGECPSLLNEDSGGDSRLDMQIRAALQGESK